MVISTIFCSSVDSEIKPHLVGFVSQYIQSDTNKCKQPAVPLNPLYELGPVAVYLSKQGNYPERRISELKLDLDLGKC